MKKFLSVLSACLFSVTLAHANQATLEENLKANFPTIPTTVVGTTPVPNIYAVQVDGGLVYTDENARYFFVGNLIDFQEQENLTAKEQQKLNRIDVSKLPLENAIKHVKGNGERVLYVFSDPDCPYCKKLEKSLTNIDNVTIYTFLYPLVTLHPNAEKVSTQIWCSKNSYNAWEDYMINNRKPNGSLTCKNPIKANIELGKSLKVSGTPTFFLSDGQRISGGREAAEIEALLKTVK